MGFAYLNALLTGLVAYVFGWAWTDELVAGSPYAIADPVGTGIEGAQAGLVPMVFGMGVSALILWGSRISWWWPPLLVAASAGIGAVLGSSARFGEGMPAMAAAPLVLVGLAAATGVAVDARTLRRRASVSK
ncbi:hypothetical protein ATJ88_3284 [Isoptericola jiangsuensis]|uniref:Uncharacterized protein n=1 Tax=Isoptericola jiangsuensis TaxID=548579 RepID=A0A2A9EZI4_9MICO|nr:hypothetical protein ATJ88_3284 [Isoptericola jiangsuensis]